MIIIEHLSMMYGSKLLFQDVDLVLSAPGRYGLVGANGTGKSTFLRLLTQEEEPSDGSIQFPKKARIGWLKQDQFRYEHELVLNVVLRGNKELWIALETREKMYQKKAVVMSEEDGYALAEAEQIILDQDGYTAETRASALLTGLGISEEQQYEELSTLSGGFKLRVLLAQALFNNPEILLLDEPNNYLDIVTITWLEQYLKTNFDGLLILTSHDQDFLNNLCTHVLDIDYGEIRMYPGNYNAFLAQKNSLKEQRLKEQEFLQKKVARLQAFIDRFKAGTRAKQAQSRQKMMDRIEIPDMQRSSRISPHFSFHQRRPSGKEVLTARGICKSFGDKTVLKSVGFTIMRGEKVAIIGQNGMGKSTLLNIITHSINPDRGTFTWGYETQVAYFAQEHNALKKDHRTVFDWLSENTTNIPSSTLRASLGAALFGQEDITKQVCVLSGGEMTRLLFAKMGLDQANVLVLDEPTNHLDIESRDELAKSLAQFEGTVIVVSHDRHFISTVAQRIIQLTPQGIVDYKGTYEAFNAQL